MCNLLLLFRKKEKEKSYILQREARRLPPKVSIIKVKYKKLGGSLPCLPLKYQCLQWPPVFYTLSRMTRELLRLLTLLTLLNLLTNPLPRTLSTSSRTHAINLLNLLNLLYIYILRTHTHTHTHNPLIPRADTCMRSRDRTRDIVILFRLPWTDAECQMSKALARVVFRILLMARHTRRNFMV
jgi:hypothetical protein